MVVPKDDGISVVCNQVSSIHCARWHAAWRSVCLLSKCFIKPVVLWQYKDSFGGNWTDNTHQKGIQSVTWYKSYLVVFAKTNVWW